MGIGKSVILAALFLSAGAVSETLPEPGYRQIYAKNHQEFVTKIQPVLKEAAAKDSGMNALYRQLKYRPVWIDLNHPGANALTLFGALHEDMIRGCCKKLKPLYEKTLHAASFLDDRASVSRSVEAELEIMRLAQAYFRSVLPSEKNPDALLVEALKENDFVEGLGKITSGRISLRLPKILRKEAPLPELEKYLGSLRITPRTKRLNILYKRLEYRPVWTGPEDDTPFAKALLDQIGSDPFIEQNGTIGRECKRLRRQGPRRDLRERIVRELAMSRLYFLYMDDRLYGRIDWNCFRKKLSRSRPHAAWVVHPVLDTPELLLLEALKRDYPRYAFGMSKPHFPFYAPLREAYLHYRKIVENGGWNEVNLSRTLKPGEKDPSVPDLRRRLRKEGDLSGECPIASGDPTFYDPCLEEAVMRFQDRHGLIPDGILGKLTRKALEESARSKLARLRLNLERLKWLKRDPDRFHIYVNIPDFRATVYDRWKAIENMKVVTGRSGHETPVFYGMMKRVVLNPYWRIPPGIVRHETIPKLQQDPGYAPKRHIEIHTGWSETSPSINPYQVDWHLYGRRLPPWHFMQSPGKFNALGKVKFLFPNRFSVYMHDTPEKALFRREIRAFSHGCVRLGRPIDMLKSVAGIEGTIDMTQADKILESNRKTPLYLRKYIPVDLVYLTAWVDRKGTVQFRGDIYGYDTLQLECMKRQ